MAVSAAFSAQIKNSQVFNAADNFKTVIIPPAWRSKPSWMVVATKDRTINPDLERCYATRANSHKVEVSGASHAVHISRPKDVAPLIEEAASHGR
jgi:pimeloyl-ACP methyl ester carboxylesterase